VTLRIEESSDRGTPVLKLSGRVQVGHLGALAAQIGNRPGVVLDLAEVTLVDVETVRFLCGSEAKGIELRHCPSYVREWMRREQAGAGSSGEAADGRAVTGPGTHA
jgi:hypothetical protein